jgi:hypothetical protein
MSARTVKTVAFKKDIPYTIDLFTSIVEKIRGQFPSSTDFEFEFLNRKSVPKKLVRVSFLPKVNTHPKVVIMLSKALLEDPRLVHRLRELESAIDCRIYIIEYREYNKIIPKNEPQAGFVFKGYQYIVRMGREESTKSQVIDTIKDLHKTTPMPKLLYLENTHIPFKWIGNVRFFSADMFATRSLNLITETL